MSFSTVETIFKRQMDVAITQRLEALALRLCNGSIENMEEYKHVAGQMVALRDVSTWLSDIEHRVVGGGDERKEG